MPATIRVATPADALAMADVFVAAWRSGYRGVVPDDVIDALDVTAFAEDFASGLADADRTTVVAVDAANGAVVGWARFGTDRHADTAEDGSRRPGYLASLYVHPSAGGRGVGRALLEYAIDAIAGVDIHLWVFAGNARARRLYERAGFRPDGAELTDPRWRTPRVRYRRPAGSAVRTTPH